jgi:ACS family tartrate transporter-like MFS transporter
MWIARIMITWGLFSGATAFVTGATSFAVVRFLLGVCEAVFFPGMILYFTYWFPSRCRGQVVGWFMTAIPVAIFLGGPISTLLLVQLDGFLGLAGWRWLFLCEAVPAVILGFAVLFYLTDRPAKAHCGAGCRTQRDRADPRLHRAPVAPQSARLGAGSNLPRDRHREPLPR